MAQIISCSIDVTKIDKSKLVEGKNGAKYFNFNLNVNDQEDKYGKDCSISLPQTKEERAAKANRTFIGNGKTVWRSHLHLATPAAAVTHQTVKPQTNEQGTDTLPF